MAKENGPLTSPLLFNCSSPSVILFKISLNGAFSLHILFSRNSRPILLGKEKALEISSPSSWGSFFFCPEEVEAKRHRLIFFRLPSQNKRNLMDRINRKQFTLFSHKPLKFRREKSEGRTINILHIVDLLFCEKILQGTPHIPSLC